MDIFSYEDYGLELLEELKAGNTIILGDISAELNLSESEKDAHAALDLAASVNVPLIKKDKLHAIHFIHFNKPHHFTAEEITLIEETADRTWAALERARAEKALREAQENLNIALEAAQMGTWYLDISNATSKRNFRHDQIFGYDSPQQEWNQYTVREHVIEEDRPLFDAAFANAMESGKLNFELRIRWPDGSIHWMAVNGLFYFDENGKAIRGAGVNFEITERRKADQALRESEQRFRNLVEASALAVWETNPEGEVEVDSPSWRKFTGQTFEEWKGTGWKNCIHPDDLEGAVRDWEHSVRTLQNFDTEFRIRSAAGDYRWTNIKGIPILDTKGKVTKWSGMNLDINHRKEAEAELRKAKEEAEEASRAKEDFVSTMSHEIRTPLNAIIGLTNLLIGQKPREDQKENLSSLSFSARNLLILINDILDFSKLEAGKMEISVIHFNLPDLLSNLQKAHQPLARANKSEIILDLDLNIPEIIATDQVKLSQILHNLVSNAVKFTRLGEIKIMVRLNRKDEDLYWLDFTVKDTGIGIAADKVKHIFDKFAQAESSTVRNYGGTGLGLSITKLLLELLGSEIKLESEFGKGSTFYFTLPVKPGVKDIVYVDSDEITEDINDLSHLRVLLVEDVEINRKIIMQFLYNWWLLVPDEAITGKEAVEKAKTTQYDLILMDIRMPEMDGYEATDVIRKLPGYDQTPVLALTADKNQEAQQARQATQFTDMLTKPFEPRDLKRRILHHLSVSVQDGSMAEGSFKRYIQKESSYEQAETGTEAVYAPLKQSNSDRTFEVSRYEKISGGNREIFEKLIKNAIRAFETYKHEFIPAAKDKDLKILSDLVHKNTTSIHYVQANTLAGKIEELRELLKSPDADNEKLEDQINRIEREFDEVIEGLREY